MKSLDASLKAEVRLNTVLPTSTKLNGYVTVLVSAELAEKLLPSLIIEGNQYPRHTPPYSHPKQTS